VVERQDPYRLALHLVGRAVAGGMHVQPFAVLADGHAGVAPERIEGEAQPHGVVLGRGQVLCRRPPGDEPGTGGEGEGARRLDGERRSDAAHLVSSAAGRMRARGPDDCASGFRATTSMLKSTTMAATAAT